jgi:hypothetical protein
MVSQLIDVLFSFLKKQRATKWFGCVVQDQPLSHNYLIVYSAQVSLFWMTGKMTRSFYSICIYTGYFVKHHRYLNSFNLFRTFHNRKIPAQWIASRRKKPRCVVCLSVVQILTRMGTPVSLWRCLFWVLLLETFQGLSWITILNKREKFSCCFWPIRLQK